MPVFDAALTEMYQAGSTTYGPAPFQEYAQTHGVASHATARYISVDSLDRLAAELRHAKCMVLRLGQATGNRTAFGLVQAKESLDEYFFQDVSWAADLPPRTFRSRLDESERLAFLALAPLGEKALVNLAIASGVIADFLDVDEPASTSAPATSGHGRYTFSFRPREDADAWEHNHGQVEVDALYAGRRDGEPLLAVLEAKLGPPVSSLAKHKLLYPWLALKPEVRDHFECVPVYLRAAMAGDVASFWLARTGQPTSDVLPAMEITQAAHYEVRL